MEKIFFSGVLFLLVVVGCSEVDDLSEISSVGSYDPDMINFEMQTTKAMDSTVTTMMSAGSGFVVYGLQLGDSSWYGDLDGNNYIYNSTAQQWEWGSSIAPAWADPFIQMNFYAYYPAVADGFTLTAVAPSTIVGEIVVEPSILDQTDFLASSSGDVVAKPLMGMQSLYFTHIMAKVTFSVLQEVGVLTVIRQLGIENIIAEGSYDYIDSAWRDLSNSSVRSFDDYVGSSGPFAKYGVEDKVDAIRSDKHQFMLIPQQGGDADGQTPLWDGSVVADGSGGYTPSDAYISIRYRTNSSTENLVGHAIKETASNDTEWAEGSDYYRAYNQTNGSYTGPLYVKAGFRFSAEQLNWAAGSEYDYTLPLNKTGGIYLSEYYVDVDGANTKIRIDGAPNVGDSVYQSDVSLGVTVAAWSYVETEL